MTAVRTENYPMAMVDLARRRTAGILRMVTGFHISLKTLAESCYMQGATDMADAAVKAGWVPSDG